MGEMRKILIPLVFVVLSVGFPLKGYTASGPRMIDYCASPPFLVQAAQPNIMIVMDMSGSMQFPAYGSVSTDPHTPAYPYYDGGVAQCGPTTNLYNGTKVYYGYFKTDKFYQFTTQFVENGDCTEAQRNDPASWDATHIPGNLLNWATMSRIDILRKVLIGGYSHSVQLNAHTLLSEGGTWEFNDTTLQCRFSVSGGGTQAHELTITNYGGVNALPNLTAASVKTDVPEAERRGVIQDISDRDYDGEWDAHTPNFGLMLSGAEEGEIVKAIDDGGQMSDFLSALENRDPVADDTTPTGEALINALDYFTQRGSFTYGWVGDSAILNKPDPWANFCELSFILLISDGEWGGTVDPVVPAYQGQTGTYNGAGGDLRSDLDGTQVVTTYTVYAFSDSAAGRNALQQTALYGGFTDKDGNNWPYPNTGTPGDSRTVTLPYSQCNPSGTYDDYCYEWEIDRDGVPDNYYSATEGESLKDKITEAIYEMLRRASSGTSVSVLSTSAEGEGSLFQALFNYKIEEGVRTVYWVGYLNGLWIDQYGNIREDTAQDQALVLSNDKVIKFFVDTDGTTKVKKYRDNDGNGRVYPDDADDDAPSTHPLSQLSPIWEAGKQLALRDDTSNPRTIYTFLDLNKNKRPDGSSEWGSDKFVTSNYATLKPFLNAADDTEAQNIIKFIRGQFVSTMRDRRLTVDSQPDKVWKLGDITYSTPVSLGAPMEKYHQTYGDSTYHEFYRYHKNRRVVVYAGANDGMLHAFNAGFYHEGDDSSTSGTVERGWYSDPATSKTNNADIGKELWAYIPYNLLPHLKWLTSHDYCHVYYVDLKPKIVDARIFTADATHPNGWGTILIGGMRLGGGEMDLKNNFGSGTETRTFRSAYFALDITNPETPNLLWEFTDADLGFTTSYPTVIRVGPQEQAGNWYIIFGSGVATLTGDGATSNHYVYILDLATGGSTYSRKVDMAAVDSEISNKKCFMADPISVDLAVDYQVDKGYIGASYYNVGWKGKMYRINVNEQTNPNLWTFSTFMSLPKPVTAAPTAAVDPFNRLWVYFGTGRYFNDADRTDTSDQKLYGVWDPGTGTVDPVSGLNDVTNLHVYENKYVYDNTTYVSTFNQYLAARRGEYSSGTKKGWYITLTGGERSLHKPTILGGIVLFPTFKPSVDLCEYGGTSYLYAPYYETGTANDESVIGLGANTITIDGKTYAEIARRIVLGSGMPTHAVIHSGQEEGVVSLIQLGTGVIMEIAIDPAFSPKSQTLFWEERR